MQSSPIILCIGGHDPSGGAGIQADIETSTALACRAITVITALTQQNTHNVSAINAVDIDLFKQNLDCLIDDIQPDIIKIGLLANAEFVKVITEHTRLKNIPIVLDPVLAAGGGKNLSNHLLIETIIQRLLKKCLLITPNRSEARKLAKLTDAYAAAMKLVNETSASVLLTGADETAEGDVTNQLLQTSLTTIDFTWPKLSGSFHGSGCTLATACACFIAKGLPLPAAVEKAQEFTYSTLLSAEQPSYGQHLPTRRHNHS